MAKETYGLAMLPVARRRPCCPPTPGSELGEGLRKTVCKTNKQHDPRPSVSPQGALGLLCSHVLDQFCPVLH